MAPTPFVFGSQLRGGGTAGFIKDKPGSQGVLFRGGTELSDDRWPRGYTPERQAAVVDALGTDRSGPGVPNTIRGKDVEDHGQYPLVDHSHEALGTTTMGTGVPEEFRRGS